MKTTAASITTTTSELGNKDFIDNFFYCHNYIVRKCLIRYIRGQMPKNKRYNQNPKDNTRISASKMRQYPQQNVQGSRIVPINSIKRTIYLEPTDNGTFYESLDRFYDCDDKDKQKIEKNF